MKVILLTDVQKVGRKYEVKEVADGYAQNFLIPSKKAELATKSKLISLESLTKKAEEERKVREELLAKNLDSIAGKKVSISRKANDKGHLFEGIHADDIVKALNSEHNIELDSDMIATKEAVKSTGDHTIDVEVGEAKASFTLEVNPE